MSSRAPLKSKPQLLGSQYRYLFTLSPEWRKMGLWFPQDGVGRNNSLLKGKNLARKAPPILRDPVPEIPCTVAFWNRLWNNCIFKFRLPNRHQRFLDKFTKFITESQQFYRVWPFLVNEMHYQGDKGPVTVQLISEDEKFWLMQLGFFSHQFQEVREHFDVVGVLQGRDSSTLIHPIVTLTRQMRR